MGSVNVDLVLRVTNLPARGETVAGGVFATALGGKGANQAAAAARLGARTWLVGLIGDDRFGADARRDLEASGVDTTFLGTTTHPTGVAVVVVDDNGDNQIAVASGANFEVDSEHVENAIGRVAADAGPDAVVLAGLEVPDAAVAAAARVAAAHGLTFVLNPAPARPLPRALLGQCAVISPNEIEAALVAGGEPRNLLDSGVGAVVLTRGAGGCDLLRSGVAPLHQRAFDVDAVDTTGAGDAFSGALAWAMASGVPLEQAVRLAAGAGALATRALGARASLPDRAELEAFVAGR